MPDKQDRYRKRKSEQGLKRVEVLVPAAFSAHLKAYARALRDAHKFGAEPPLFDGIRALSTNTAQPQGQNASSMTLKRDEVEKEQIQSNTMERPRKSEKSKNTRPDFSKGLLDE